MLPLKINGVSLLKRLIKNQNVPSNIILNIFRTVRISRLDAIEGLVLLTDKGIMIIDGLALTSQNIIVESVNCPDYKYISYNNVLSIRKRRYSLMTSKFKKSNKNGLIEKLIISHIYYTLIFYLEDLLMIYPNIRFFPGLYQTMNHNDETSYRCLSKPMGAQTQERLDGFLSRYREWDNVGERLPKFLYATFYSTSMTTCSLLVRMEPFSSNLIELQGGNFDLPDRMFHCLKDSWRSAAFSSSADVKELLPEFYYLPEFLTNENKFCFGKKQSGIVVDDTVLPPWAKNDPREFIRINRAALESEYVSNNINNWIDLIFGYKQTGKKAIKSHNVFHSWFYKGSVNLDNVSDETIKRSIISFINNFGQVPKKIFSGPHPKRKPATNMIHINTYNFALKHIYVSIGPQFNVAFQKQILIPPYFKNKLSWERFDMSVCVISYNNNQPIISNLFDTGFHSEISSSCFLDAKYLAFGCVDGNLSIWKYRNTPNFHFLHGHQTNIECIISSSHQKFMITGSIDGCVYIWDIIDFTFLRKLSTNSTPIISLSIIESTSDIVVFQTHNISIFSAQGLNLATKKLPHKIYYGISICNDLQDKFQYLAVSTFKGIEIWKYGPEEIILSQTVDNFCQELGDDWVLCNNASIKTSSTEDEPLIRIISHFRVICIFEQDNDDTISCLTIDQYHYYLIFSKNKSLYAGTTKGNIYIVNRGILPST
ncbi:hypothetical protein MXB_179 [Myxobolus squamalis]|nr:hypothetical protein MXB_179 [Myxobolus squamalis]